MNALVLGLSVMAVTSGAAAAGQISGDRDGWLERLRTDLRQAEYSFSEFETLVFSAPNRAHGLRSRVSPAGLEVFPRETGASGAGALWTLRLASVGLGRAGETRPLEFRALSAEGARVEVDRGEVVEWFENSERGLEQGWTILRPPIGTGELEITLAVTGELSLCLDEGGFGGTFVDGCGEARLRYEGLRAWDACGVELSVALAPSPAGLVVRVEDDRACYPVQVDPLLTSPAWTVESDQAFASLGYSVSTAGDVNGDGYSDVIVGTPDYDGGQAHEGRAWAYHGSATGLSSTAAWTVESDQVLAGYGASVSTAGDVNGDGYSDVIIGAPFYDNVQLGKGRVWAYLGSATGLSLTAAWTAEANQTDDDFGLSVSTAGDVNGDGYSDVIVGAPGSAGVPTYGSAYVYHGSAAGLSATADWEIESFLDSSVGSVVSTAGDVNGDGYSDVIIGAPTYIQEGVAFVYHGSAMGLSSTYDWFQRGLQTDASFGRVSTAGDVNGDGYSDVIVGANRYDGGEADEGRAFVYHGSATGLSTAAAWTAESNQVSAHFGSSVSMAGDVNGDGYSDVIVGAPDYDEGETDEGRAFVYHGSAAGLGTSSGWEIQTNQVGAHVFAVSGAGDVNGDGYSDLIVTSDLYDNGQVDEGRAFVFHGSPSGPSLQADWSFESNQAGAELGRSAACAGDVNGDGYDDVLIGASRYDAGQTDEGRVYLFLGSLSGLASTPAGTVDGDQVGAELGEACGGAGDVNGDGFADVALGAWLYDGGETDEGRVLVFQGSSSGLGTVPAWTMESDQAGAAFGLAVRTAGDVNGDGYSDLIVGARDYDAGEVDEGRAFVYHGSAGGLAATAAWTAEGDQVGAGFGCAVASAGDVNGDGFSDVVIGAEAYDDSQVDEGKAFVYHGSPGGLLTSPAWTSQSGQSGAFYGKSVASAGDVNGDGYSEVVIGAPQYDGGEVNEGRAFVYHGSASGLSTSPGWAVESDKALALFGFAVAGAGDVNGDGYSDILVGARDWRRPEANEGRALVYYGNGGDGGLVHALQQRSRHGERPLALLSSAGPSGLFRIHAEVRERARFGSPVIPQVWLEWEVKPLGVPFDGTGIESGTPQLLGFGPIEATRVLEELVAVPTGTSAGPGLRRSTGAASFRWRARVATDFPLFPHTAWFGPPGNNVTEAKLRKPRIGPP